MIRRVFSELYTDLLLPLPESTQLMTGTVDFLLGEI